MNHVIMITRVLFDSKIEAIVQINDKYLVLLMLLKQYGEAIKEFNESISIYNGNFENYYNIAKCLFEMENLIKIQFQGKYDEAIDYYDKAIQLNSMGYYHQEKKNCLKQVKQFQQIEEQKNSQKAKP